MLIFTGQSIGLTKINIFFDFNHKIHTLINRISSVYSLTLISDQVLISQYSWLTLAFSGQSTKFDCYYKTLKIKSQLHFLQLFHSILKLHFEIFSPILGNMWTMDQPVTRVLFIYCTHIRIEEITGMFYGQFYVHLWQVLWRKPGPWNEAKVGTFSFECFLFSEIVSVCHVENVRYPRGSNIYCIWNIRRT